MKTVFDRRTNVATNHAVSFQGFLQGSGLRQRSKNSPVQNRGAFFCKKNFAAYRGAHTGGSPPVRTVWSCIVVIVRIIIDENIDCNILTLPTLVKSIAIGQLHEGNRLLDFSFRVAKMSAYALLKVGFWQKGKWANGDWSHIQIRSVRFVLQSLRRDH